MITATMMAQNQLLGNVNFYHNTISVVNYFSLFLHGSVPILYSFITYIFIIQMIHTLYVNVPCFLVHVGTL